MGRDCFYSLALAAVAYFNSHARVGRDIRRARRGFILIDFNSHARVGRDFVLFQGFGIILVISTHTPAWGATTSNICAFCISCHFNSHARVGRDELGHVIINVLFCNFNSHARVGRD